MSFNRSCFKGHKRFCPGMILDFEVEKLSLSEGFVGFRIPYLIKPEMPFHDGTSVTCKASVRAVIERMIRTR